MIKKEKGKKKKEMFQSTDQWIPLLSGMSSLCLYDSSTCMSQSQSPLQKQILSID